LEIRERDRRALILLALALAIYALADWVVLPAYDRIASAADLASEIRGSVEIHGRKSR
jgi:hypothetical protein